MSEKSEEAKKFEEQFRDLISYIEESTEEINSGKMADLTNMDHKVAALCESVENADTEVARSTQPLMAEMIAKLDQLAQALNDYQQKAQGTE